MVVEWRREASVAGGGRGVSLFETSWPCSDGVSGRGVECCLRSLERAMSCVCETASPSLACERLGSSLCWSFAK